MSDFPTLTTLPSYPLKEATDSSHAITSKMESGYVVTRSRYSKKRKKFSLKYVNLPKVDKDALDVFIATVDGPIGYFNWTHPVTGTVYVVRFEETPSFELVFSDGTTYYYNTEFVLAEV